jgi:putative ABC transport system permease protein
VRRVPAVRSAALASFIPFDGKETLLVFDVEGEPQRRPGEGRLAQWRVVSDGFFETMGVPLLRGRTLKPSDTMAAQKVAVVSAALVRRFFPDKDPIGERVTLDELNGEQPPQWFTIVGVVEDVRFRRLTDPAMPVLYYPAAQQAFPEFTLVARTGPDPMALVPSLRGIVRSLDPSMPLTDVRTMDEVVASSIAGARFRTTLLASFALVALLLAAIGVYGVMSYSVEQRSQEMGLRMALGASPRDVLALVTAHGVRLALAGILLGLVAAYAVTRVLESLLFGVSATDPVTFAGIAALLAAVASLASYLPARRATKTDPMVVLRTE